MDSSDDITIIESKIDSPITISEDSRSQASSSVILLDDLKEDSMSSVDIVRTPDVSKHNVQVSLSGGESATASPVSKKRGSPKKTVSPPKDMKESSASTENETVSEVESTAPSPVPKKKGRPRKIVADVHEDPKVFGDSKVEVHESGRPKRSCRGQSVCDILGIKPRKSRGSGRGGGSLPVVGNRSFTDRLSDSE